MLRTLIFFAGALLVVSASSPAMDTKVEVLDRPDLGGG